MIKALFKASAYFVVMSSALTAVFLGFTDDPDGSLKSIEDEVVRIYYMVKTDAARNVSQIIASSVTILITLLWYLGVRRAVKANNATVVETITKMNQPINVVQVPPVTPALSKAHARLLKDQLIADQQLITERQDRISCDVANAQRELDNKTREYDLAVKNLNTAKYQMVCAEQRLANLKAKLDNDGKELVSIEQEIDKLSKIA